MTAPLLMNAHAPWPMQTSLGRQPQLGVPAQAAGTSAQNGSGGSQGGGMQPGRPFDVQRVVSCQAGGQTPASLDGVQTATPPPQLGWTQTCPLAQVVLPHAIPPWPPAPVPADPP
jgi:hypothetical protein